MRAHPDFRSPAFLRRHAHDIVGFYDSCALDPAGGFFHAFKDDGQICHPAERQLISSAGFVALYARMLRHFATSPQAQSWRSALEHGLNFLERMHREPSSGSYAWSLHWQHGRLQSREFVADSLGLAHVLNAHAHAVLADVPASLPVLDQIWSALESHFYDRRAGLYACRLNADGELAPHRRQSVNLALCEAFLSAWTATGDRKYLERADQLAELVTDLLASRTGGLIWEDFHVDWSPDQSHPGEYDPSAARWGFRIVDQMRWSRLLLQLDQQLPGTDQEHPRVQRARELFARATRLGWDRTHEGLVTSLGPNQQVLDTHRHHDALAEAIIAAALLGQRTASGAYWDWYDRFWGFAWKQFIDHRKGGWWRALNGANQKISDDKSPPGKVDLPNLGACLDILEAFETQTIPGALS